MTEENVLTAAIYIRVSTLSQFEEGFGLEVQKEKCKALALVKDWQIYKFYEDVGVSGTLKMNEKGFDY